MVHTDNSGSRITKDQHLSAVINNVAGSIVDALGGVQVVPHSPAIYRRTASSLSGDAVDMLPWAIARNWQVVLQVARYSDRNSGSRKDQGGGRSIFLVAEGAWCVVSTPFLGSLLQPNHFASSASRVQGRVLTLSWPQSNKKETTGKYFRPTVFAHLFEEVSGH